MKRILIMTALCALIAAGANAQRSDKTFAASDKVKVEKVSYKNRYDITVVADMYLPRDMDSARKYPAIVVGHPYGGVKEQSGGLYAQQMAERGFIALAFDLSFGGESGGTPRHIASPEIYTEDFSASVDFIGTRPFVDRERIGAIGICGSGGFAISAATIDPRIRAVATVSMYDMGRARRQDLNDGKSPEELQRELVETGEQRWREFEGSEPRIVFGTPEKIDADSPAVAREFYDYYRTPRGQHARCTTGITQTSNVSLINFYPFANIRTISPRPILLIAGENAHSRYFSEDAFRLAAEPRELYIVPGAGHVDLYDRMDLIPFGKLTEFFTENLKSQTMKTIQEPLLGLGEPVTANFTGMAWLKMLSAQPDFDCQIYNVTFAPSTRNYWHKHSVGQILVCTEGVGFYQERGKTAQRLKPGTVVNIPADAVHWHGAAPDSRFTHIGITPRASTNQVEWMGAVSDDQYAQAVR